MVSAARPSASNPATLRRMRTQKRTGTTPEMNLRRALWTSGLRYRVDALLPLRGVRRKADLLFIGPQVAVFVDGCFWHACPQHGSRPKSNGSWWREKLDGNVRRDRNTDCQLRDAGWEPIRVWEHEDMAAAALRVESLVRARQPRSWRQEPSL